MKPTLTLITLVALSIATTLAAEPLSVSGIYPHLTVFNSDPKREKAEMECGLGAAVPWAGKLWSTTYTSHVLGRGNDKLFAILPDMSLEIRPESVGGTSACRMIHRESKQLFIASYAIDEAGKVRVIPRDQFPGRLTALARHLIGRTTLMDDLMHLAQQTDSSRLITLQLQGTGLVVPIEGVTIDHHNLSHHGKDPEKLRQLGLVEEAEFKALGDFLRKLHESKEEGSTQLDKTMVYFGSNLGNASSHDTKNMPTFLAGGGFKHGQHLAFDPSKPAPVCNLYVQMLQQLGLEVETFASGKGGIPGFAA